MMRILWVCNIMIPAIAKQLKLPYSNREGWLTGLLDRIVSENRRNQIQLGIAFPVSEEIGRINRELTLGEGVLCHAYGFIENLETPEIYDAGIETQLEEIIREFKPDMVHIFGTEFPHALACVRVFRAPSKTMIGLQGIISACAEVYMADIPEWVQKKETFRDKIRKDSLLQQQNKFHKRGVYEKEALRLTGHVAGRTDFDRAQAYKINPDAKYHFLNETLRSCFYKDRWRRDSCVPYRIFLSQGDYPLKGFHYLLQAMPKVLEVFPEAHICVAGSNILKNETWNGRFKISAYGLYLKKLIKKNGLKDKVTMLGRLDEEEMKEQYLQSHIFVCPSALENSPNSLGEAMLLGVPSVAADVGGVHNLLTDGGDGLLYPAGDIDALADRILEVFQKELITGKFSDNARRHARDNHDADQAYYRLLSIYREITMQ